VPIAVGVRGFFEATLDAWYKGVEKLTGPPASGQVTDRGPILRPQPGQTSTVSIPGLFDVVKLGAPDPNDPATKANNRAIAKAIQGSPEPEYAQGLGEIMTAVDNVRDVLALGVIAGRVTLAVAGAGEVLAAGGTVLLGPLLPELALPIAGRIGIAVGFSELAGVGALTAAGGIILPILAIATGALLIAEMAHWMAALAIPGYALLCRGPAEAAFAVIPALLWGRGLKSNVTKLSRINPWAVVNEVREVRAGAVRTFVGHELIEGGRATAVIGGYGWLLGGIVGTMTAGAFAAQRLANGDNVNFDASRLSTFGEDAGKLFQAVGVATPDQISPAAQRLLGRSPIPGSNLDLYAAQMAAECLWSLPCFLGKLDRLMPADFASVLAANLLALDILQPYLYGADWRPLASAIKAGGIQAPPIWAPWTRELIGESGLNPESGRVWPLPGAPTYLHVGGVDDPLVQAFDTQLRAWMTKYDGWIEAGLCGALLDSIVQRLLFIITESEDGVRTTTTPPWQVLFSLAESNRQVLITYGDEAIQAFWSAAEGELARQHRGTLTGPELDQLAAAVGMRLIVTEPPPST